MAGQDPAAGRLICRWTGHCGFAVDGVVRCGELGANLAGVRVMQVVEDGQRLLPGIPGLTRVACGVVGVPEASEDLSLVGAVGWFAEQAKRPLVAGDRIAVL